MLVEKEIGWIIHFSDTVLFHWENMGTPIVRFYSLRVSLDYEPILERNERIWEKLIKSKNESWIDTTSTE